ncbi:MAG: glycosyltransferase family 39 protein [Anaerolineales bacterium]|jgi:4-amino-4-deoxy-L-arabinose transferase-like glycosyltransferase
MNKKKILVWLYLVIIVVAVLLPRLLDLDQYVTTDEPLWLHRSANFYYALGQREFQYTYQDKHPGVTIMWAGAAGFLVDYPEYRGMGQGYFSPLDFDSYLDRIGKEPLELLVAGRVFVVLGAAITLAIAFLITSKLIGTLPAFIGFLFIAFDPFIIALNTILHPDALLPSLMLLSAVAYIAYLTKDRKWIYLIISVIAAAWSWMTKYSGLFLIPYVGLVSIIYAAGKKRGWRDGIKRIIFPILLWLLFSSIAFAVFWPAMWVAPLQTLSSIFNAFQSGFSSDTSMPILLNGEIVSLSLSNLSFYPLHTLWRSTPAVLIGLVFVIVGMLSFLRKRIETRRTLLLFALFVIFYISGLSLGGLKANRYIGAIFLFLDLIAGIGWFEILDVFIGWLRGRYNLSGTKVIQSTLIGILVISHILLIIQTHPYYWAYYNPLLGGTKKAVEVIDVGYGEGLDQAASYLKTKPDASDLKVLSWYGTGPLSYYFPAEVQDMLIRSSWGYSNARRLAISDYVVTYVIQWQKSMPKELIDVLSKIEPEYTAIINGVEYAKVYKVSDILKNDYENLMQVED